MKIGYVISLRDFALTRYQNYVDTRREMGWPPEAAERMEEIICRTIRRLSGSIPDFSFFLYNYNFNDLRGRPVAFNGATSHCCLWVPEFMRFEREGCSGLQGESVYEERIRCEALAAPHADVYDRHVQRG